MSHMEHVLDLVIDATAASFLENPANYSDERALAEDVRTRLCAVLTPASVADVTVEESSKARGSLPDHENYTGRYRKSKEIDRVQCEIGGAEFPFSGRNRLDLGVFSDDIAIRVKDGTQEFEPSDLVAAIEFKYVKNINYLRYQPDDDHGKYRDIADDLGRLGDLPEYVDRRLAIFSNYDLLRRDSDTEAKRNLQELADANNVDLRFVLPDPIEVSDGGESELKR